MKVPDSGITTYSSRGELTWTIKPRSPCELAGGNKALGGIVVRNSQTESELLLTRKGVWFLGSPDVLQPLVGPLDLVDGDSDRGQGPADACRLSSLDVIQGISWAADW